MPALRAGAVRPLGRMTELSTRVSCALARMSCCRCCGSGRAGRRDAASSAFRNRRTRNLHHHVSGRFERAATARDEGESPRRDRRAGTHQERADHGCYITNRRKADRGHAPAAAARSCGGAAGRRRSSARTAGSIATTRPASGMPARPQPRAVPPPRRAAPRNPAGPVARRPPVCRGLRLRPRDSARSSIRSVRSPPPRRARLRQRRFGSPAARRRGPRQRGCRP